MAPAAGPRRALALHGALDLAFAALYAWLGLVEVPSRRLSFTAPLLVLVALLAASGLGLLVRARGARQLALATQGLLLAGCLTTIALLVAALLVEGGALLPLFQIAFLLRPEVRRLFAPGAAGGEGAAGG